MGKKSIWFDKGTLVILKDYQKKTKQSFSRTVCIMVNNCVKYGKEDMYFAEQTIQEYMKMIKARDEKISTLEMQIIRMKHIGGWQE